MLLADVEETGNIVLSERQTNQVDSLLAESDSVRVLLRECLERDAGADVTVDELVEAYAAFCPTKGWQPFPITEVHKALKELMLEMFHVTQSHDMERGRKKSLRGYSNLSLTT